MKGLEAEDRAAFYVAVIAVVSATIMPTIAEGDGMAALGFHQKVKVDSVMIPLFQMTL